MAGEPVDVGLAVVPNRIAAEQVDQIGHQPECQAVGGGQRLEVVQDRFSWRLDSVGGEQVWLKHDGVAVVEIQTIGQDRVMAEIPESAVQRLGHLGENRAVVVAGCCQCRDGEPHERNLPQPLVGAWVQTAAVQRTSSRVAVRNPATAARRPSSAI